MGVIAPEGHNYRNNNPEKAIQILQTSVAEKQRSIDELVLQISRLEEQLATVATWRTFNAENELTWPDDGKQVIIKRIGRETSQVDLFENGQFSFGRVSHWCEIPSFNKEAGVQLAEYQARAINKGANLADLVFEDHATKNEILAFFKQQANQLVQDSTSPDKSPKAKP